MYVMALAARAGYMTSVPGPDRDSIDLHIQEGGPSRPALDLQLKATTRLAQAQDGLLRFRLSSKNHRDLSVATQTPRLVVMLQLPNDESRWMTVTSEELVLRHRAYWLSLQQGHEEVVDQGTVTVRIPKDDLLDANSIEALMERSRKGEI